MSKIGAVIVTYNIKEEFSEVVNSIIHQVDMIIIVDNGSIEESRIVLKNLKYKYRKILRVNYLADNKGIAFALNQGVKELLSEDMKFILTLDHDSICSEGMINSMINTYRESSEKNKIRVISPAIYDINKKDYLVNINRNVDYEYILEPIQSGCIYIASVFYEVGYFNEDLFIYYVDTDFHYRIKEKGYLCLQCNKIILNHEEGKKIKKRILGKEIYYNCYSDFAVYYRARNYIYMKRKYRGLFTSKDRFLKDLIKFLLFDDRVFQRIVSHFKGLKDGYRKFK